MIYGTASAIIFNTIFFPNVSPAVGIIASFGAYAVGFGARPLGGLFFSRYGDRLGRKWVLVCTLFLMGVATFAIGLLPTYAQAGVWAPILLVACRFLQGFGAGAEQAGGVVLLTETAAKGRRGRFASLVFVGAAAGTAMGAVVWMLVQLMPAEALLSYGWRLVFFSSIFVTLAAWLIRRNLKESPVMDGAQGRDRQRRTPEDPRCRCLQERPPRPVQRVLHERRRQRALLHLPDLHGFLPDHLPGRGLDLHSRRCCSSAPCSPALSAWVAGNLSDKFGRRPMYLTITGFLLLFPFPAFMLLNTGSPFWIAVVIVLGFIFAAQGTVGVQAAYFPELFGSRYRYAGVALGREFSSVFGGGIAPLICSALVTWASGSWIPVAIYMTLMMAITFIATLMAPETRDRDLLTEEDAH